MLLADKIVLLPQDSNNCVPVQSCIPPGDQPHVGVVVYDCIDCRESPRRACDIFGALTFLSNNYVFIVLLFLSVKSCPSPAVSSPATLVRFVVACAHVSCRVRPA